MKKSKIIAGILSAVITLSAFAGCGNNTSSSSEEGKATTVTIGTLDLVNGDLIAQYEKWYETELGVDVKIVKFDSGKDINSALASGSIDIGQEGTSPAALAIDLVMRRYSSISFLPWQWSGDTRIAPSLMPSVLTILSEYWLLLRRSKTVTP